VLLLFVSDLDPTSFSSMSDIIHLSDTAVPFSSHVLRLCGLMYVPLAIMWLGVWLRSYLGKTAISENVRVALLCLSWMVTSIVMHTLNKDLVTILNAPCVITWLQMCIAALVMFLFHFQKIQEAVVNHPRQCSHWLVVSVAYSGMLLTSLFTYRHTTLSVMTIMRNLAPLIVLPIELCVMSSNEKPKVSKESISAMCIMLTGAILYGCSSADISKIGVCFAFLNMVLAIVDRMLQRRLLVHECKDMRLEVCTFTNNMFGMIPVFFVAGFTHEVSLLEIQKVDWWSPGTALLLSISGLTGLGICFFGLAVQKCISATSFLVLQNVSKFAVVLVGITLFGDAIHSQFIVVGLACSLGGSFLYGISQLQSHPGEEQQPEQQPLIVKHGDDSIKADPVVKHIV